MSSAAFYQPRYTYQDYLRWEGDWELWHGMPVAMAPSPFGAHERVVTELVRQLANALLDSDCKVYANLDWVVAEDTVVRPDAMVVCGEQPEQHLHRPPVLAAEVLSPSTAEKDRQNKSALYAECKVQYYLIVDPTAKTLEAFQLQGEGYQTLDFGSSLKLSLPKEVNLDVDQLFD